MTWKGYLAAPLGAFIAFIFGMTWAAPVQAATSLSGKVIVVDAGHGGPDSGAQGVGSVQEKHITLAVAKELTGLLRESGAIVIQTRDQDQDLATDADRVARRRHLGDLRGRLDFVKGQEIDAFVSIHCNASTSSAWRGAQVLYFRDNVEGERLAKLMQDTFREELLPTARDIQANRTLYLLKRIDGPTVLAEVGFVTNPEEASLMQTQKYQHRIAFAMYVALNRYFSETPPAAEGAAT